MSDSATTTATEKERLINPAHLTGSALAAGAATAAASYFGLAGTIIGAVAASVVATVVNATSTHSLKKWPKLGLFAAAVLVIVMGVVTSVEGLAGRPLSSFFGGGDDSGTTIGNTVTTPSRDDSTDEEQTEEPAPSRAPTALRPPAEENPVGEEADPAPAEPEPTGAPGRPGTPRPAPTQAPSTAPSQAPNRSPSPAPSNEPSQTPSRAPSQDPAARTDTNPS